MRGFGVVVRRRRGLPGATVYVARRTPSAAVSDGAHVTTDELTLPVAALRNAGNHKVTFPLNQNTQSGRMMLCPRFYADSRRG